jgi:putative membrane protein
MMWGWGGIFLVICIVMMVWMMAGHGGRGHAEHGAAGTNGSGPRALQILAERFARGEITEEEFEQRKRVVENRPS